MYYCDFVLDGVLEDSFDAVAAAVGPVAAAASCSLQRYLTGPGIDPATWTPRYRILRSRATPI